MVGFKSRTLKGSTAFAAVAMTLALTCASVAWAGSPVYTFDIPAENGAKALNDFSKQADIQILFPYDVAARSATNAIKGAFTRDEVLAKLLAATGLEVASESATTISLRVAKTPNSASEATPAVEVIVTGTHIRGGNPTSPVHTVTRKDIEQSGYSQIGDVMRSLPENFSGGQNPGVIAAATTNISNTNLSSGSTVNLRGLGTDATLVLLNGHRMAADGYFQSSDISGVPLAAVQRIEVVPDGASALYGSDAVAGVANIILRKNYSGAEISARIGGATQGGGTERTYSVLGGISGIDGYVLGNLEYSSQDPVFAPQRSATSGATPATTLIPSQERRSFFIGAGRNLTDNLSVSFDGIISDRATAYSYQDTPIYPLREYSVLTPSYSAAASLDYKLAKDWTLHVTSVAAGSRNSDHFAYPAYDYSDQGLFKNALQYVEMTADGTLLHTDAGDIKLAIGGGARHETFVQDYVGNTSYQNRSRDVRYLYAELYAPLVSPSETRTGLHELDVNLSARTEDYSDFGKSSNPKVGIRYVPTTDLTFRATWGKSFKAPTFLQMYGLTYLVLRDASFVGGSSGTVLMTQGANSALKPERSESMTFGADYSPSFLKSATLSATWFDIDYTDRVVQPIGNITTGLSDPTYAPFVEASLSAGTQAAELAKADLFYNFASVDYDPSAVVALIRDTYTNSTAQKVRGLDLSYRQTLHLADGTLSTFANATWVRLDQQTIMTAPDVRLSGTIFNVPDLKARAGLSWQYQGLSATGIVNYVSGETDTGVSPAADIASWTTVDATITYTFQTDSGFGKGVKIALAASNLFDKTPPYAASPGGATAGIYFDSTNTSIMGRFLSLSLTKAW